MRSPVGPFGKAQPEALLSSTRQSHNQTRQIAWCGHKIYLSNLQRLPKAPYHLGGKADSYQDSGLGEGVGVGVGVGG